MPIYFVSAWSMLFLAMIGTSRSLPDLDEGIIKLTDSRLY
jgi:hypothetical protein